MNTVVESPRRRLERLLGIPHQGFTSRMADVTCPFRIGARVRDRGDPRHVGEVLSTSSGQVRVRWLDTGWKSSIYFARLERADD